MPSHAYKMGGNCLSDLSTTQWLPIPNEGRSTEASLDMLGLPLKLLSLWQRRSKKLQPIKSAKPARNLLGDANSTANFSTCMLYESITVCKLGKVSKTSIENQKQQLKTGRVNHANNQHPWGLAVSISKNGSKRSTHAAGSCCVMSRAVQPRRVWCHVWVVPCLLEKTILNVWAWNLNV